MKLVILACLAAVAVAVPHLVGVHQVPIIRDDSLDNGDGNFNYAFETENGITVEASDTPGQANIQGDYRYTLPDGTVLEVHFIANENGYQPESPWIPTPYPRH